MPLTFTHQNEHPSWSTQFGRQLLQMLAQGVIGGGTNLLQGAIMQGIKNRDASTENQKQRELMGGMQEDKANAAGDIQRQRDMARQIGDLRTIDAANARSQANLEAKPMAAFAKQLGLGGDPVGSAGFGVQGEKFLPKMFPVESETSQPDKPSYDYQPIPIEGGKVGDPMADEPGYITKFTGMAPKERPAAYSQMLPESMRQKMTETQKPSSFDIEPRKALAKYKSDLARGDQDVRFRQNVGLVRLKQIAGNQTTVNKLRTDPIANRIAEGMGMDVDTLAGQLDRLSDVEVNAILESIKRGGGSAAVTDPNALPR
jgi:hypothetical protein